MTWWSGRWVESLEEALGVWWQGVEVEQPSDQQGGHLPPGTSNPEPSKSFLTQWRVKNTHEQEHACTFTKRPFKIINRLTKSTILFIMSCALSSKNAKHYLVSPSQIWGFSFWRHLWCKLWYKLWYAFVLFLDILLTKWFINKSKKWSTIWIKIKTYVSCSPTQTCLAYLHCPLTFHELKE